MPMRPFGRIRQPAKEISNALHEYAVKKDDRLRQIGETGPNRR
jgi:hypothetical protein